MHGIILYIYVCAAALSTFVRFFPRVKARYDYGILIFILTFSLISVSGFREDEILDLAHKRLSTVIMGGVSCVLISIFICPVWAGQDLHSLLASNFDTLSRFLQGSFPNLIMVHYVYKLIIPKNTSPPKISHLLLQNLLENVPRSF